MKIVVVGGTGLIGSKVVDRLLQHGHEAVPASPSTGVDTLSGRGLSDALSGAQVVVDVSNSPSVDSTAMDFFEASTRNLLAAETAAGVGHHVALSPVGTERLSESPYFRAKIVQEYLVTHSAIPWSVVHTAQVFEFLENIADGATVGATTRLAPVAFRPMAADDVARIVVRVAVGVPLQSNDRSGRSGGVPAGRTHPRLAERPGPAPGGDRGSGGPLLRCPARGADPGAGRWSPAGRNSPGGVDGAARQPDGEATTAGVRVGSLSPPAGVEPKPDSLGPHSGRR